MKTVLIAALCLLAAPLFAQQTPADPVAAYDAARAANVQTSTANATSSTQLLAAADALKSEVAQLRAQLASSATQAEVNQLRQQLAAEQTARARAEAERDAARKAIVDAKAQISALAAAL